MICRVHDQGADNQQAFGPLHNDGGSHNQGCSDIQTIFPVRSDLSDLNIFQHVASYFGYLLVFWWSKRLAIGRISVYLFEIIEISFIKVAAKGSKRY